MAKFALLRQPGVVTTVSLIGGNSRGSALPAVGGASGHAVLLSLDIPGTRQYPSYACVLIDAAGAVVWRVPVSAAQAQDTVSINVPAGVLRAGDYTLLVQGLEAQDRAGPGSPEGRRSGALPVCLEPEPLIIVGTPSPLNASRGPS